MKQIKKGSISSVHDDTFDNNTIEKQLLDMGLDLDYLEPITANTLLLSRSGVNPIDCDYELDCGPRKRLAYIRQMDQDWWEQ